MSLSGHSAPARSTASLLGVLALPEPGDPVLTVRAPSCSFQGGGPGNWAMGLADTDPSMGSTRLAGCVCSLYSLKQ